MQLHLRVVNDVVYEKSYTKSYHFFTCLTPIQIQLRLILFYIPIQNLLKLFYTTVARAGEQHFKCVTLKSHVCNRPPHTKRIGLSVTTRWKVVPPCHRINTKIGSN